MKQKFYDRLAIIGKFLSDTKYIIVFLFTLIGGISTSVYQYVDKLDIVKHKDKQIAQIAEYYNPPKPVDIKITNPCGKCEKQSEEMSLYLKELRALQQDLKDTKREYHGVK